MYTCKILSQRQILGTGNLPQDSALVCINIDISPEMAAQSAQRNQAFCVTASDWSPITAAGFSVKINMAAPMEVPLPQTMLQKLLDLLKLEAIKSCRKIHVHVICHIRCQVNIDYHKQHESTALIGLFPTTSSVLPSVDSYPNYRKPTQRGVQG